MGTTVFPSIRTVNNSRPVKDSDRLENILDGQNG